MGRNSQKSLEVSENKANKKGILLKIIGNVRQNSENTPQFPQESVNNPETILNPHPPPPPLIQSKCWPEWRKDP